VSAYNAPAPAYPGSLTSSSLISPISLPPYPTPGVSANNTPDRHIFALPMPRSRTPSNTSASSVDDPSSRAVGHISGILAILCLAGCTDERGVHSEPLRARFGEKLSHIADLTETLARMLREGVSSAWFEVLVERPSVTPPARSKGRLVALPSAHPRFPSHIHIHGSPRSSMQYSPILHHHRQLHLIAHLAPENPIRCLSRHCARR